MIYLFRHGQTLANTAGHLQGHNDTPLTEIGRRQSKTTADFMNRQNFKLILVSPLKRVSAITSLLFSPWIAVPELVEIDFGNASGEPSVGARERWGLVEDRANPCFFTQRWPNGESYEDLSKRLDSVADTLSSLRGDGAVVAHQTVIAVLVTKLIGAPIEAYPDFKISNDEYLELNRIEVRRLKITG